MVTYSQQVQTTQNNQQHIGEDRKGGGGIHAGRDSCPCSIVPFYLFFVFFHEMQNNTSKQCVIHPFLYILETCTTSYRSFQTMLKHTL